MENFTTRYDNGLEESLNIGKIISEGNLTNFEIKRLERMREAWNFYEGYHWEDIPSNDTAQVTYNYCRTFVNKFVSFELGAGFTIETTPGNTKTITVNDPIIKKGIDVDGNGFIEGEEQNTVLTEQTEEDYLNTVWNYNKRDDFCVELGQTKSITGEAWVKVQYQSPEELDDPFEEYPNGKIKISCIPTQYVFPKFDDHDRDKLVSLLIMYPIRVEKNTGILRNRISETTVMYKEFWTKDEIKVYQGDKELDTFENPYGLIPFVQIKNFIIAGRSYGAGDLDDLIPLNIEYNTKKSDVSEVIDYHSAPITLVYGAKIGNLEKGANKVWGGLPKDSKVENLGLNGDLIASNTYTNALKTSMCEVGAIPETVLGGASAISNTSGVALQYMNAPLIDRTKVKRQCTKTGLELINKMILYISLAEGLIEKPESVPMKDFLKTEVNLPDTLPKDDLIELQKIQQELLLGLECRHGAMKRLGKDDIDNKLAEIDKEREEHPELFNSMLQTAWYQNNFNSGVNSGMTNGSTAVEQVRQEVTGQNGGENTGVAE